MRWSFAQMPKGKAFWIFVSILQVALIGLFDYLTGYELASSPFYLLPIITITWFTTGGLGIGFALLSALSWLAIEFFAQHPYSHPSLLYINTFIRLATFLLVVYLVYRIKQESELNKHLARTDLLTGLPNTRSFYENLQREIDRFHRYGQVFSLLYLDLDNFKMINDEFGHKEGDLVIAYVANALTDRLRKTDSLARIGGDEFAVILPETDKDDALQVCKELSSLITGLMQKQNWRITTSIGCVTVRNHLAGLSVDSILNQADNLMYQVKRSGKNNILFEENQPDHPIPVKS